MITESERRTISLAGLRLRDAALVNQALTQTLQLVEQVDEGNTRLQALLRREQQTAAGYETDAMNAFYDALRVVTSVAP